MGSLHSKRKFGFWILTVAMLVTGSLYFLTRGKPASGNQSSSQSLDANGDEKVIAEVTHPHAGGIDRICMQPGTIEPIAAADLYAKVSGYLVEQKVDIGDVVKAGQELARISAPEHVEKQIGLDVAEVTRAKAKVQQMAAAIETANADLATATAMIAHAEAEKKSKASSREFRQKQLERIKGLVARMAIDAKLEDEHEDQYQAAVSAELAASESVVAAQRKEAAARARVKQAEADLKFAEAEVKSARAKLEKSKVLRDYTIIRSPYNGVVTKRNFHIGEFVRSADSGADRVPILAVDRTDKMRVVIQIPDRDVPFVDRGDSAVVEVDALSGQVYKTRGNERVEITRMAASEDPHTRMMRAEIHLTNPDGKLRRGMFGRVTLVLQRGVPDSLRIPSAALVGKTEGGKGMVRVVKDGKPHLISVSYGTDNGSEIEVLSGLTLADQVIVRANGVLNDDTSITTVDAKPGKSGH